MAVFLFFPETLFFFFPRPARTGCAGFAKQGRLMLALRSYDSTIPDWTNLVLWRSEAMFFPVALPAPLSSPHEILCHP